MDSSLYVDDRLISYCSEHMEGIERKIQLTLNRIEKWANTNGLELHTFRNRGNAFKKKRDC